MGIIEMLKSRREPMVVPRGADLTGDGAAADAWDGPAEMDPGQPDEGAGRERARAAKLALAAICRAYAEKPEGARLFKVDVGGKAADGLAALAGAFGEFELLPARKRAALSWAFGMLEEEGLARVKWSGEGDGRAPAALEMDAAAFERAAVLLGRSCAPEAPDAPKRAVYMPYTGVEGEKKVARRAAAGRKIAAAFVRAASASQSDPVEISLSGDGSAIPELKRPTDNARVVYRHALGAAQEAGLIEVEWSKGGSTTLPKAASCPRAAVDGLTRFYALSAKDAQRAAKPAKPEESPEAAREKAEAAAAERERTREMLRQADALLRCAAATRSQALAAYFLEGAQALADGRAQDVPRALSQALGAARLSMVERFFAAFPEPCSPEMEMRCASAVAFDGSKRLEGAIGGLLSQIIEESGAAAGLAGWGIKTAVERIWVGGGFALEGADGADADMAAFPEGACVSCDWLSGMEHADARGVRALIVVENLAAFRQGCRDLGDVAAFLYTDGHMHGAQPGFARRLAGMLGAPIFGWYDIDAAGFQRFHALNQKLGAAPLLMGLEVVASMSDARMRKMSKGQREGLGQWLAAHGGDPFEPVGRALKSRDRFVEQEALLDGFAQDEIRRVVSKAKRTARKVKPTDEAMAVAEGGVPVTGNMVLDWCAAYDAGSLPDGYSIEVGTDAEGVGQ